MWYPYPGGPILLIEKLNLEQKLIHKQSIKGYSIYRDSYQKRMSTCSVDWPEIV